MLGTHLCCDTAGRKVQTKRGAIEQHHVSLPRARVPGQSISSCRCSASALPAPRLTAEAEEDCEQHPSIFSASPDDCPRLVFPFRKFPREDLSRRWHMHLRQVADWDIFAHIRLFLAHLLIWAAPQRSACCWSTQNHHQQLLGCAQDQDKNLSQHCNKGGLSTISPFWASLAQDTSPQQNKSEMLVIRHHGDIKIRYARCCHHWDSQDPGRKPAYGWITQPRKQLCHCATRPSPCRQFPSLHVYAHADRKAP